MKNKYFKVMLCNDDIKKFDIICKYPFFSAEIKEVITNRTIFKRCSEELCLVNYGLTYEGELEPLSDVEALTKIKEIVGNETTLEEYSQYLDEVEKTSMNVYDEQLKQYKIKKRKARRKKR